jgi:hypothetical protein
VEKPRKQTKGLFFIKQEILVPINMLLPAAELIIKAPSPVKQNSHGFIPLIIPANIQSPLSVIK